MFRTHKDIMCHKAKTTLRINIRNSWEVPTGHREDRTDTTMDNRPKRQRTRSDIKRAWRREYNVE